ncbi:3-galactosyl-N-acetylglucosaminide 4-alpha-L-fucosyltransferase FUT3-like isoform X2 [Watersipora subatra]
MVTKPQLKQSVTTEKPAPTKRKLERTLLILVGSPLTIAAQTRILETDAASVMHRELLFGNRGRDANVKNDKLFDVCAPGCELTTDASRFNESDVVIFYAGGDLYRVLQKTIIRAFPEQRFVFFFYEQPHNFRPTDLDVINKKVGINWTLHYQQDATVFWPYGWARPRDKPINIAADYASSKTRKVIWVVSRCSTLFSHREHYIAELIKYIDIDVYGKCIEGTPSRVPMDVNKMAGKYKFFISFENGDCDDYISEKFFRYAKDVMTVPIVLGRRNHYEQLAPAFSYIQADQFDSPKDLAEYLHALDRNKDLYNKYFEWRKNYVFEYLPRPVCQMCQTFRDKWFQPSQIDMQQYHGLQRCWKSNRNILTDWTKKAANYTYTDPWTAIKQLNSRDKELRFK